MPPPALNAHQPQAAARRKMMAAARASRPPAGLPPVWFMTDPLRTPDPATIASRLPRGWGVIFRTFGAADRLETGLKLAEVCRRRGLILFVAGDAHLARQLGADGAHWPERMAGRRRRQGLATVSAHSRAALLRAKQAGATAAILSAVFASRSPSAGTPMGAVKLRRLARSAPLPVYALGGVGAANVGSLIASNGKRIAGWAAIEALMEAFG